MFYRSSLAVLLLATAPAFADPPRAQPVSDANPFARVLKKPRAPAPIPAGLHCEGAIVWAAQGSSVYHTMTSKHFGTSKRGMYGCEDDAQRAGLREGSN